MLLENTTTPLLEIPAESPQLALAIAIPITIIYFTILITGIIGNISTCIVIARNKSMHTATNYYFFSLAISDMLLLVSGLPPEMYRIWSPDHYIFGGVFCVLQSYAAETSANASILIITAFTIERYLAICHPFLSHTLSKLSRAIRSIVLIWIVALCMAVPQAIQFGIDDSNGLTLCTVMPKYLESENAFIISTFVFFVGPMTLISVLYVLIGVQLRESKNIAGVQRPSLNTSSSASRRRILRHNAAQNRVVKMLIAVVAAFFVCWAPFHAQRLLAVYLRSATKEAQAAFLNMYTILMYTSGVLYFLSTTVNPVLYHIMSNKFRKAFKKTFICKSPSNTLNRSYRGLSQMQPSMRNIQTFGEETNPTAFTEIPANITEDNKQSNHKRCNSKISQSSRSSDSSRVDSFDSQMYKHRFMRPNSFERRSTRDRISRGNSATSTGGTNKSNLFSVFKLFGFIRKKSGYVHNPIISNIIKQDNINNSANTISNSSLQDLDDPELSSSDLIKYMQEINEKL